MGKYNHHMKRAVNLTLIKLPKVSVTNINFLDIFVVFSVNLLKYTD